MFKRAQAIAIIPALLILFTNQAYSQGNGVSEDVVRQLQEQIRQLQLRVETLESQQLSSADSSVQAVKADPGETKSTTAIDVKSPLKSAPRDTMSHDADEHGMDADAKLRDAVGQSNSVGDVLGSPRLKLRGFGSGDYGFRKSGSSSSFSIGQLDLFLTSRISNHLSALLEGVFEYDSATQVGSVDMERALLRFHLNRYFNADFGRFHTGIGYYNSAYHHGAIFQTTVGRPFLFSFEDEGGILPVHNVGISVNGDIPSGSLDLHYLAEVGNGRRYGTQGVNPIQGIQDENGSKALNLGGWMQPSMLPGIKLGTSVYVDKLKASGHSVRQAIYTAYAVYNYGRVEVLNEAVLMRNSAVIGSGIRKTTSISGGYSQLSYRIGSWHPYFRFEVMNPNDFDPVSLSVLTQSGWSRNVTGGVRYDFNEFAAFKLQFDRLSNKHLPVSNRVRMQLAFAF
jgi:hypothetical protein